MIDLNRLVGAKVTGIIPFEEDGECNHIIVFNNAQYLIALDGECGTDCFEFIPYSEVREKIENTRQKHLKKAQKTDAFGSP